MQRESIMDRYASAKFRKLFGGQYRANLFRLLWWVLLSAQFEVGFEGITKEMVEEVFNAGPANLDRVAELERETRHDVMAHLRALAEQCPLAGRVFHLGATSAYVQDNADMMIYWVAMDQVIRDSLVLLKIMKRLAIRYRSTVCLGQTHYQSAIPVTVGKRMVCWMQEIEFCVREMILVKREFMLFRGVKGTVGTLASFLELVNGDHAKVGALEERVRDKISELVGSRISIVPVCGQTSPRSLEVRVVGALCNLGVAINKIATDLRLLAHDDEIREPFGESQVGSSAMPFKRNPMRCERACSLSYELMACVGVVQSVATRQMLERTLDDSAARRLNNPEAFCLANGILRVMHEVFGGLEVNEERIAANLARELPFLATETVLMRATKAGGDRQELHELLRVHCMEAHQEVKANRPNNLFALLAREPAFATVNFEEITPATMVGLAPEQVDQYLEGLQERLPEVDTVEITTCPLDV